jgi:ferric enterobactin receptor
MVTDGGNADASLSSDAIGWSARVNGTWKVTPELDLQAMYSYRAPMTIERGRFSAFQMSNISLRRKLKGDRASVSLRLMDPFNTMGFRIETGDERITQVTRRKFGARALYLNVQYSIGKAPRPRQRRPEESAPQQPGMMP